MDGDGIISMDDFRYMLDLHRVTNLVQISTAPRQDSIAESKDAKETDPATSH